MDYISLRVHTKALTKGDRHPYKAFSGNGGRKCNIYGDKEKLRRKEFLGSAGCCNEGLLGMICCNYIYSSVQAESSIKCEKKKKININNMNRVLVKFLKPFIRKFPVENEKNLME